MHDFKRATGFKTDKICFSNFVWMNVRQCLECDKTRLRHLTEWKTFVILWNFFWIWFLKALLGHLWTNSLLFLKLQFKTNALTLPVLLRHRLRLVQQKIPFWKSDLNFILIPEQVYVGRVPVMSVCDKIWPWMAPPSWHQCPAIRPHCQLTRPHFRL